VVDSLTTMTYDALGRRVEAAAGASYIQSVYGPNGGKLALINGLTQAVNAAFLPLPGGATAVYDATGLKRYRHSDWLGSSRLSSTTSRTISYDGAYSPMGESYAETGSTDRNFTGQNQELANDLYAFPFREYHSIHGRWLSPDPAGTAAVNPANPQSWNRYAYVNGSPLNSVDPLGLATLPMCVKQGKCVGESIVRDYGGAGIYGALTFAGTMLGVQTLTLSDPTQDTVPQYKAPEGFTVTIVGGGTDSWEDPGSASATQELTDALVAFFGNGPKHIEYGPDNPFTRDFMKSAAMDAINAKIEL